MTPRRLPAAGLVLCLLALSGEAWGQPAKLDARLRARRGSAGYAPAGAGGAAASPVRSVFLRLAPGTDAAGLAASYPAVSFGVARAGVVTARAPDALLDALAADPRVLAVEASLRARPTLDAVRSSAAVSGVYLGAVTGLASTELAGATGAGVVVGVVDTGIDWQHLDFINDGANTSRILGLWDQTITSHTNGAFPSGYSYGAEYTNANITAKLQGGGNAINSADVDGHGTHVASIAAGDGTSTNGAIPAGTFAGLAPSADLVVVKTTFDLTDIVDGMNYIVAKAAAAGKRAVINLSLGVPFGPHDGSSAFEQGVAAVAASTPVVVAMGNDQANSPHAKATVGAGGSAGFTAAVNGAPTDVDLEFWHPGGDGYTAVVTLNGVGGSVSAMAGNTVTGAVLGGHTIDLDNGTTTSSNGHKLIYVWVRRGAGITTASISVTVTRTASGGTGRVDGYLDPSQLVSFTSNVDATGTLGEPAAAPGVFSVGSYASKKFWTSIDTTIYNFSTQSTLGDASHFSARGPTRDGRQAPELSAPGDVIGAALSSASAPGQPATLTDARHRILRGTSMASPVVTGVLAARLQWGPNRTVSDLRSILRAQARTDSAVTGAGTTPNDKFGYGKLGASPQPVATPSGLTATTLGTSSIAWSWGAVLEADAYALYYATNPAVFITSVTALSTTTTGLAANTTTGILVKGRGAGIDGAGSFVSTATFALPPTALPTATPHVTSVTVSFPSCPAAPVASSCGGYQVVASTSPDFGGTQFGASTTDRAQTSLSVTGLAPLTAYWFRLATLNPFGAPSATGPVTATTLTDLVAPINPLFSQLTDATVRFDWTNAGNPPGLTYYAQASTDPAFGGTVLTQATTAAFVTFSGLTANTTYSYRVQAASGPFLGAGPLATLAVVPGVPAMPFSAASQTGVTVSWTSGGNPSGTRYRAEISSQPSFAIVEASVTLNASASFSGLVANTLYYARVRAEGHGGSPTAYAVLGSTPTLVQDPAPLGAPFSAVGESGLSYSFGSGGNPAGTLYLVRLSTDPAYATLTASSVTANTTASFTGLDSNRLYYAAVAALNLSGTPTAFFGSASTATPVSAVSASSAPVGTKTVSSLTVSWGGASLGPGTAYLAEASVSTAFAPTAASSTTLNRTAVLSGLAAHTPYFVRVRALSSYAPNPDGAWTTIGSPSTLAQPPTAAGVPFPLVGVASVTVAWTPPAAATSLRAEASRFASFSPVLASSVVAPGAGQAHFDGLAYATPYYFRVASLNADGDANYFTVGSTLTPTPALSSAPAGTGTIALTLTGALTATPVVLAEILGGTFPPGTVVTMLAGVTQDLSQARSRTTELTPLAPGLGVDISAQGYQPLKPVRLTMTYDPALLPAGLDPRSIHVARYDEASGVWALVPSATDSKSRTITASLTHFSAYAPFFTVAGASVDSVRVFPVPWEIGEPLGPYAASALTFASLPAGARVRIVSLLGELVWEGQSDAGGILNWDGRNRAGRPVASGTYYASIESGGSRTLRRVVLIR